MAIKSMLKRLVVRGAKLATSQAEQVRRDGRSVDICLTAALREILEAAARGKAIVSTRVGAEGLELRDGIEIILRDGAAAFALVCVELLADPVRCETLGMAAHEIGSRRYDRRQIVVRIKDEIGNPDGLNKDNHDICFGRPKGANRVEIADAFERLEEGIRHES